MTTDKDDNMKRGMSDNYQAADAEENIDEGIQSDPEESGSQVGIGSSEDEELENIGSAEQASARAVAQFNEKELFNN